jgi:hypothetical protein
VLADFDENKSEAAFHWRKDRTDLLAEKRE